MKAWNEPWVCVNYYSKDYDDGEVYEGWSLSYKNKGDEVATLIKNYELDVGSEMVNDEVLVKLHDFIDKGYEVHIVL